jgi:hypothetical protein
MKITITITKMPGDYFAEAFIPGTSSLCCPSATEEGAAALAVERALEEVQRQVRIGKLRVAAGETLLIEIERRTTVDESRPKAAR